jgi:hypothetical protein
MKKFTSLLIGCSLALAGAAFAQQPEDQATPPTKGKKPATEKTVPAEKTHKAGRNPETANAANPEATTAQPKQHGAKGDRAGAKGLNAEATSSTSEKAAGAETKVSGEPGAMATPVAKQHGKGKNAANAKTSTNETTTSAATGTSPAASATPPMEHGKNAKNARGANAKTAPSITPATVAAPSATPAVAASASAAPSVAATGEHNATRTNIAATAKKPEPQKLQQIKEQHASFRAQPRPDKVPAVTFQANYRVQGSERWEGPQYEVYRSYHPERHDQSFYHSHYSRVELIGGGYYYFNNGYWYPAWGYSPREEYYAYDAPIYVGHRAEPPDRVIADVQAELQEMGYYKGEVDGLLGPLTREAVSGYQADQGLTATAVIDEPTLDALGMG